MSRCEVVEVRNVADADGFPVQELPARNALTVGVRCVNRTRKHAASVTAYSVLRACPSIQCSTPKLHQQTTGNVENEKELKLRTLANYAEWRSGRLAFSVSVPSVVHLSSALCPATATIRPYRSYLPHG
jgi:hypothetical protein